MCRPSILPDFKEDVMNREEELLKKRFIDLANAADRRGIVTFTDFLNLNELNIFHGSTGAFSFIGWKLFGGYEHAERQIAAFLPDALSYNYEFPIVSLKIRPLQRKFAEDLNHRDYLGALLNLGVDRAKIGDILVGDKEAVFFCEDGLAPFLKKELCRVKHTPVQLDYAGADEIRISQNHELVRGTVSSVRLDSVLSVALKSSRSSLVSLVEEGKVFVNGRLVTSNGYQLKENDLISVRGSGRFRFLGSGGQTRKGRCSVEIEKW